MTCRHPEIARINYLLASGGASLRPLAAKFGLYCMTKKASTRGANAGMS